MKTLRWNIMRRAVGLRSRFHLSAAGWTLLLVFMAFLPALALRDFTPDNELRYLSIADEAISSGSVFCFTNHGAIYADKPPLYLWITMLGRLLFGNYCMLFLGIFSLVPMLLVGKIMNDWCRTYLRPQARRCALLMLFTCGYFPFLGLTLRMDMLMTLFIVLALREVYRMVTAGVTTERNFLLGVYLFAGLFTKGPLGVLIPLLASILFLLWHRRLVAFFRIYGWATWSVLIGCCLLWWGAVYLEWGNADYLNNLLFHQTIDRASRAFTHARPWWYYLVAMWYVMAPWSLMIAWLMICRHRSIGTPIIRRMLFATFAVTLISLSCFSSKLQVYLLPAIPFVVYLGMMLIDDLRRSRMVKIIDRIAMTMIGIIFIAGCLMPLANPRIGYGSVCREIQTLHPEMVYVDSSVRRGENIDAYFDVPVTVVNSSDSDFRQPANTVLILKGEKGEKITYKYKAK
ncbi:MAG: ArnT family glycosyltransferase [Lepagella sp.]